MRTCAYFHGGPSEGGWWWVDLNNGRAPFVIEVPVPKEAAVAHLIAVMDPPPPKVGLFDMHLYRLTSHTGSEADYIYEGVK